MSDDLFTPLVDLDLDIDPDVEQERDEPPLEEVLDDDTISLLRRANRVAIARAPTLPVTGAAVPADREARILALLFVLQAHPDCTFAWSRMIVDFNPTPDSIIRDLAPRDVADVPVEIQTSGAVELSLSAVAKAVDLSVKPELSHKRTVYFPTMSSGGVGFRKAFWDFYPKGDNYLNTDKELKILLESPAGVPVSAMITVRAKVRFRGMQRLIPLLARTKDTFAETVRFP
jgi:hypothetical protein